MFSRLRTEYWDLWSKSPYLVQMRENTDQKNSEYGHFSCSDSLAPSQLAMHDQHFGYVLVPVGADKDSNHR